MKFTVADLIEQLPHQEPLSLSKLEKGLGLSTKADKEQLRIALTALTRVGVLEEADDGISRVEDEGLIEARLRCSSKGFCFALREDGGEDIYIRDNQLNHAWNGDPHQHAVTVPGVVELVVADVDVLAAARPKGACSASFSATPPACWRRWSSRTTTSLRSRWTIAC